MNVKDWTSIAMLLLAAGGVAVQLAVSVALRGRDREDFEQLRSDHDRLKMEHEAMARELSNLKGRLGDRA